MNIFEHSIIVSILSYFKVEEGCGDHSLSVVKEAEK